MMNKIRKLWPQLFAAPEERREQKEIYRIARCIGCGQCNQGCPVAVKIKVKK